MSGHSLHRTVAAFRRRAILAERNDLADGQLLHLFLVEGEEAAFEALLRRHGRMVLGVCRRILQNPSDADDAFQATFLVLLRKAGSLLERQTIGDWLYGVAQNTALKTRSAASKRRVKERQAAEMAEPDLPVEEILWQEWRPLLDQEVLKLPAKYRTLIVLCDLQQRSYREAAHLTGCSTGTVAGRLSRARDMLARRLKRYGVQLSTISLAALLTQNGIAASTPPVAQTMKAVTALTSGNGAIAEPVALLTQGVLQTMWMNQFKQAVAAACLVLALGAGIVSGYKIFVQSDTARATETQTAATADAQADARAVIEKAIKAHGGEENLGKFKAVSFQWEGKQKIENAFYWDAIATVTYQMPGKVRLEVEVTNPDAKKFTIIHVVNGSNGWRGNETRSANLRDGQAAQILDEMYAPWIASLVPLKEKGFEFALAGETNVEDKPAIGVIVSRKERPDVNLYFDKKSGLLVKTERRMKDGNNQEITVESTYSDHKMFHGVMWPTKRRDKRDGMEIDSGAGRFELRAFQPLDAMEERLLTRP